MVVSVPQCYRDSCRSLRCIEHYNKALKKDTNNSMASRTDQLIAGVPRMNSAGTSYGFSLMTGRIVSGWTLVTAVSGFFAEPC